MSQPIALDIDGTLTRPDNDSLDPRVFEIIPQWDGVVVIATGCALPIPLALSYFLGRARYIVAENGGIVHTTDDIVVRGDKERLQAAVRDFKNRGGTVCWTGDIPVNRWRKTEFVVGRSADSELLNEIADNHNMSVLDTGIAYHLTIQSIDKASGLSTISNYLDINASDFVAVGDSENDKEMLSVAGESYAVANADNSAKAAADFVTDGKAMDGTIEALKRVQTGI